jgi:predicted transcriptional regulator
MNITVEELRAALEEALTRPDEGFTTTEVAETMRVSEGTARRMIRSLLKAGALRSSRKRIQDMSGRWVSVPSYVIVEV